MANVVKGSLIASWFTLYKVSRAGATPGTFIIAPPADASGLTILPPASAAAVLKG